MEISQKKQKNSQLSDTSYGFVLSLALAFMFASNITNKQIKYFLSNI